MISHSEIRSHKTFCDMEKQYFAPAVRVVDLHLDTSFCLSGGLEDTYDDILDGDD